MKLYNKIFPIFMSFFLLISTSVVLAKPQVNASSKKIDYVFLQTAQSGQIDYDAASNQYKLILHQVEPWVTYFSSSPKTRVTGFMEITDFIQTWKKDAAQKTAAGSGKLNSAVVAMQKVRGTDKFFRFPLALNPPRYDSATQTVEYDFTPLQGDKYAPLKKNMSFQHVVLFIDDICISCVGRKL